MIETQNRGSSPAELVQRIRDGEESAEHELVANYGKGLLYLLRRLTGRADLADDFYQETFRVVLVKVREGQLRKPEQLASFLRSTARNLWIGHTRKISEYQEDENGPEQMDPSSDHPVDNMIREENVRLVRELLGELKKDRDREILTRFYLAEEAKDRLCAELGVETLYFNRLLSRARQRFRELWLRAAGERRPMTAPAQLRNPGLSRGR